MGPQIELETAAARQRTAEIITIDLLPVETRLVTYEAHPRPHTVGPAYRSTVMSGIGAALHKRRYRLASIIDRGGSYSVGTVRRAMTEDQLADALGTLDAHAEAQSRSPDRLLPLAMPARLGAGTGSDATLYVGGDGYVGDDRVDMADFLGALAMVNTVATGVATVGAAASGEDAADGFVRASETLAEGMAVTGELLEAAEDAAAARPAPKRPSYLRLTVTLVDNRTGSVLWHSDRKYPYDPSSQIWVRRALELSLRRMPRGGAR